MRIGKLQCRTINDSGLDFGNIIRLRRATHPDEPPHNDRRDLAFTHNSSSTMSSTTETQTAPVSSSSLSLTASASGPEAPSENKLPKVQKVPVFTDKLEERAWAKAQMAAAFRVFAKLGYCDGVAGHMSLRGTCLRPRDAVVIDGDTDAPLNRPCKSQALLDQ